MKKIGLLVILCVLTAMAQDSSKRDFSDFEKRLMADTDAEKPSENNSRTLSEFEQSLVNVPSELEPVYIVREQVLEALKSKEYARVESNMEKLSSMETRSLIPVNLVEKEVVYIESKKYGKLLDVLLDYYHNIFDTTRYDEKLIVAYGDGLDLYVRNVMDNIEDNNVYNLLNKDVLMKLPKHKRKKLEILLLLGHAYKNDEIGEQVRSLAESFVTETPDDPDAHWIKNGILAPLSRMDMFEYSMQKRKDEKENIIQSKLYSGGFGINAFFLTFGTGTGFDNLYRKDLYKANKLPINIELYAQFKRFALLFELVNNGYTGLHTYELGLGFVAYDSRYLKVRPYMAWGKSFLELEGRKGAPGISDYESTAFGNDDGPYSFTAAVNVDFKFITAFFLVAAEHFTSFSLVGKFGFSSVEFKSYRFKGDGKGFFVNFGLGIYFW